MVGGNIKSAVKRLVPLFVRWTSNEKPQQKLNNITNVHIDQIKNLSSLKGFSVVPRTGFEPVIPP